MRFEEVFPEATVIVLEQNYRSTQRILDAANAVIANNAARRPKQLWTEQIGGELITRYHAEDEHDEAAFVVRETMRLVETEGNRFNDVAVFYRTNAQSRIIEEQLVRAGVPYRVVGGVKFYDRREVKDLLAYLRALVNPDDEVSWRRVVNTPKRGVGETSVNRVAAYAQGSALTFREALHEAAAAGVTGKALGGIGELLELMETFEYASDAGVAATVESVLEETGYIAELEAEHTIESQGRIENLQELVGVCREFDEAIDAGDLTGLPGIAGSRARRVDVADGGEVVLPTGLTRIQVFLEAISLVTDLDTAEGAAGEQSAVTLMTLHSAKGLEYPVVFMTGLEDGVFPHVRSLGDPDELEEERRLCYVGITRASRAALPLPRVEPDAVRLHRLLPAEPLPLRDTRRARARARRRAQRTPGRAARDRRAAHRDAVVAAAMSSSSTPAVPMGARGAEGLGLRVGDDVAHDKFGEGVVIDLIGDGDKTEAIVNFPEVGEKRLLLAWAPLQKI